MAFKGDMPIDSRSFESELRLRVRRRIKAGRLPVALVSRIDSSYETARICCVCDQPITDEIVDYDVVDLGNATCLSLSFHFSCYVIWQKECARRVADAMRTNVRINGGISPALH